ncbi:hypothetical protein OEW28_02340 [Defluviimonas sp. WL0002]|uniref:Uncharacterized protein n=1 Tax=Albidovulum marisflavi TaxID=2984159 RepID=A0ABT2Z8L2_9RHOB|nr:hypothetical protein [Defluviimonas sp. WL0002]MCV2867462.1 hypothetical protein [Defluviimonas sp. WL0002]
MPVTAVYFRRFAHACEVPQLAREPSASHWSKVTAQCAATGPNKNGVIVGGLLVLANSREPKPQDLLGLTVIPVFL